MGYRVITFTTNDKRILRILDRAGKYKLRSVLIVRALQSVDLEEILKELMQELLMDEDSVKESPVKTQKPTGPAVDKPKDTKTTTKPEETGEGRGRTPTLLEEFGELL